MVNDEAEGVKRRESKRGAGSVVTGLVSRQQKRGPHHRHAHYMHKWAQNALAWG